MTQAEFFARVVLEVAAHFGSPFRPILKSDIPAMKQNFSQTIDRLNVEVLREE